MLLAVTQNNPLQKILNPLFREQNEEANENAI